MKKNIATLFSWLVLTGISFSLHANGDGIVKDEFESGSLCGWYIPSDHNTGFLQVDEKDQLIVESLGQQDWCTLNREITVDFGENPELAIKVSELPSNISFHMKVERLANADDFVFLEINNAFYPGNYNNVYAWDVKQLLNEKFIELNQEFKIQVVFQGINGVQQMAIDWVRSDPYFVEDEFKNAFACNWYIPSDHTTGTLSTNENEELVIQTSGLQDWCSLNREIKIDFGKNPEVTIKINRLPENISFHMKIENLADHNEYVFLQPSEADHPFGIENVYTWNVKKLLEEEAIDLVKDFKLQLVFEHISGEQTIAIDWVRSWHRIQKDPSPPTSLEEIAGTGIFTVIRKDGNTLSIVGGNPEITKSVSVFDVNGKITMQAQILNDLDISLLNKGIYIIHIVTANQQQIIKFIK
ncbi:MAG: T9SS type A sorting domain-containing protein [Candidatus Azobacteroides sp.]|nr:T9SS type A sorting domain-containing protein [Candidatus Azobacteroides sp.]